MLARQPGQRPGLGKADVCAVAGIIIAGTLAGCSSSGVTPAAAARPLEERVITVDAVPAAEEGGLYVAQAQGFFAQFGLTVKINSITGAENGIFATQTFRGDFPTPRWCGWNATTDQRRRWCRWRTASSQPRAAGWHMAL